MENTLIYMQGAADPFHIYNQQVPFLNAIAGTSSVQKVIPITDFWGRLGHSHSVVPGAFMPWLKALITAPDLKLPTLFEVHKVLQGDTMIQPPAARSVQKMAKPSDKDITKANLLSKLLLQR